MSSKDSFNPDEITHGMCSDFVGSDGVRRHIELYKAEDGSLGWKFTTHYDGLNAPPKVTLVSLSKEGAEAVLHMQLEMVKNPQKYLCTSMSCTVDEPSSGGN